MHSNCRFTRIWKTADRLITRKGLWNPNDSSVEKVLDALSAACLTKVDVLQSDDYERGANEKWIGTLEGGQNVVLKIVW